jgi:hypothetical protein
MIIYFSDSVRRTSMLESRSVRRAAELHYEPMTVVILSAIRETRTSTCATTVDRDLAFYVDVGCWGLHQDGTSSTNFALISGPDILLCDWMNLAQDGAALDRTFNAAGQGCRVECGDPAGVPGWWSSLASGARRFLQGA